MTQSLPVMYEDASLARYRNKPFSSLGCPCLPSGVMRYASLTTPGEAPIFVSKNLKLKTLRVSLSRAYAPIFDPFILPRLPFLRGPEAGRARNVPRRGPKKRAYSPGGNDVHAGELAPLARQRLAQVRDGGFGRVVHGLVDGDVDDVGRDARGDDQIAEALGLEDRAGRPGAEEDAIDCRVGTVKPKGFHHQTRGRRMKRHFHSWRVRTIDAHLPPVLLVARLGARLADGHAGVGEEHVQFPEVAHDGAQHALDGRRVRDLELVRLGANTVGPGELGGARHRGRVAVVQQGQIAARFRDGLGGREPEPVGAAGDGHDPLLHAELLEDVRGGVGDGARGAWRAGFVEGHGHGECRVFFVSRLFDQQKRLIRG
nr:hypothetical protein CFP56_64909 [Quercus suber]